MLELNQPNHAYDLATLGGRRDPRARRPTDGEQLTTLDGMTRTLTSGELLICDALDVPIGLAGIMGGEHTEIGDDDVDGGPRVRLVRAARDRCQRDPHRLAQRRVGAVGTRRRPLRDRHGDRPVRRAARRDVSRPRRARRRRRCPGRVAAVRSRGVRRVRVSQVNRIIGVDLRRDEVAGLLDPIGFTVTGDDPEALDRRPAELAPRLRPRRSTSSRRSPATTATRTSPSACRCRRCTATSAPSSSAAGRSARCSSGSGISEVMPIAVPVRRRPAPGRARQARCCGSPTRSLPTRTCCARRCAPGCCAPSRSTRRTAARAWRCSRSATSTRRAPASSPTSARCSASSSPAPRRRRRSPCGASSRRRSASGARIDQQRVPAGLHPTRSATLVAGRDGDRRRRRDRPRRARRLRDRRAGGDPRARPVRRPRRRAQARRGGSRRAGTRRATSTWRSCSTRTIPAEKLEKAIRQGAGNLLVGLELFDVYRGTGVADGTRSLAYRLRLQARRPHAHRRRHRRRRRPSPRTAAEKLGATLRAWRRLTCRRSVPGEVVGGVGEPAEAAGLAAQDATPELVGVGGEHVGRTRSRRRSTTRTRSPPRAGRAPSRRSRGTRAGR